MLVEVAGGLLANSLTLLADAGHMLLDASALGLSWYAARLAEREHTDTLSYGYHRFQVLAAFINALALLGLCVWIVIEAFSRLSQPEPMLAGPALAVAAVGFIVNLIAFRLLHGHGHDMNVKSAALHVLGDLLGSAAAIAAALTVLLTGWLYADPLLSFVVVAILVRGAIVVVRDAGHILLEGVPGGLDTDRIKSALIDSIAEVTEVHHLHAWALTLERPLVTLHATVNEGTDTHAVVEHIKSILKAEFGIDHSTSNRPVASRHQRVHLRPRGAFTAAAAQRQQRRVAQRLGPERGRTPHARRGL
jgi:cobalt-zinc-cadmium efflux system protein